MMRRSLCVGISLACAVTAAWPGNLCAQPSPAPAAQPAGAAAPTAAEYDRLIQTALSEFDAGNFAEARALFEQAHALRPSARTLRGLGITAFELKHYVQARDDLRASIDDPRQPLTPSQRADVQSLLARVERYIGRVELRVQPAEATLVLNGKTVIGSAFELDVGDYELIASAPGYRDSRVQVTVEGGKTQALTLQLVALALSPAQVAAADQPRTDTATGTESETESASGSVFSRWWFWTAAGAVVASAIITAVAVSADAPQEPLERGQVGTGGVVTTLRSGR